MDDYFKKHNITITQIYVPEYEGMLVNATDGKYEYQLVFDGNRQISEQKMDIFKKNVISAFEKIKTQRKKLYG